MEQLETLLTAEQTAELLGVKPATVYDWAGKGLLPHIRILAGKRRPVIRFKADDIRQFLAERSLPGGKQ